MIRSTLRLMTEGLAECGGEQFPPLLKGDRGISSRKFVKIHFVEYVIVFMNMCIYFSGICGGRLGDFRYRLTAQAAK